MSASIEQKEISAPRVGRFNVHIQGNLKQVGVIILTVHDLGCNHNMWQTFVSHTAMEEITRRVAWIHVDVPGQEDNAPDLPAEYKFPSMQSLGEDLVCVLDQLDVRQVVCLGEGAGANACARFAMAQPKRCLGVCLIHCTGSTAGFMESLRNKIIKWKLDSIGMNPTAQTYLVLHRFGSAMTEFENAQNKEQLNKVIESFQKSLQSNINPRNLRRFVNAFLNRTNISESIGKLKCPILMMTGTKASFNHTVHSLHTAMVQKVENKNHVELLEFDGVANVLEEKTEQLAESFLYFIQGIGAVGAVPMPRVSRGSYDSGGGRARSMSMEEADQPRGIYSISPPRAGSFDQAPKSKLLPTVETLPESDSIADGVNDACETNNTAAATTEPMPCDKVET